MDVIRIRPIGRRNCTTLLLFSSILLCAVLTLLVINAPLAWLLPFILLSIPVWVLAIGKYAEPEISLELNQDGMTYRHRCGHWIVDWSNIQLLSLPHHPNDTSMPLDYIGVRLKQPNLHNASIQPRLALQLIREQRILTRIADPKSSNCSDFECANPFGIDTVIDVYRRHQLKLRDGLGFDLYLPATALDRSLKDALQLLNDYKKKVASNLNTQ